MKYSIIILACVLSIFIKSQSVSGNFSFPSDKYSAKYYGKSIQNIYYKLSFVSNPKSGKKKEVVCVLGLGKEFSRFCELNTVKYDSLAKKFSNRETIGAKEINQILPLYPKWKTIVFKDFKKNHLTIQDRVKDNYQYNENQPFISWKLEDKTKDILGYTCYKAVTNFRGRKYTAWYAKDIPINNGPYLFNGLPGLIMELEDKKNHYHFTVVGLDNNPMDIYLRNEKEIFKITREKFRRIQKSYHDNPSFFIGSSYDENGNAIRDKIKSKPYNPIELE